MIWLVIAAAYCTACATAAYACMRSARAWAHSAWRWSVTFDQAVADWEADRRNPQHPRPDDTTKER